jgi:biotin operon repressor
MKYRRSRTTLEKALRQLRKDGCTVCLDYASWRDGYASK